MHSAFLLSDHVGLTTCLIGSDKARECITH